MATCGSIKDPTRGGIGQSLQPIDPSESHDDQAVIIQSTCEFFAISGVSGLGRNEVLPKCNRLLKLTTGFSRQASRTGDLCEMSSRARQFGTKRSITTALPQEFFIESLRVSEQRIAKRMQPRLVEKSLLTDSAEEVVDSLTPKV